MDFLGRNHHDACSSIDLAHHCFQVRKASSERSSALYRRHRQFPEVLQRGACNDRGFQIGRCLVTSPVGSDIIEPEIDFVRFTTDPEHLDDPAVQSITLANIFRADLTYVVAPEGYVGRTTCYEIGRLIQARRPIYFSNPPRDLPLCVPPQFVIAAAVLARSLADGHPPKWLFEEGQGLLYDIERGLGHG
jgi:hypothetical protein